MIAVYSHCYLPNLDTLKYTCRFEICHQSDYYLKIISSLDNDSIITYISLRMFTKSLKKVHYKYHYYEKFHCR